MGRAIQQNAQFINMMSQQRAAERQAAAQQQEMKLAQEKAGREATQAEIDNAGKLIDLYTKRAGQTLNAEGYGLLLRDMDRDAPEIAAAFRANLPPERFDRNVLLQMVGSIGDNFKATFGPLETEVVQMEDGTFAVARTGGFGKPGVFELEEFQLQPGGAPAPSGAPAQTPAPRGGVDATATRGAATGPADRRAQGVDPRSIPSGNPLQPISMTTGVQMGGQPDMTAVVQDMMASKQISQSNLQLMREMAGPDKDQQLAQILKANNIQIVPDGQPGMRSAEFRPGQDAAPQMQLAQSMEGYRPTGRAARGKDPMQSPLPGSAQVPTPVIRQQAEAEEEGKLGPRITAEPQIEGGKKTAELRAQRDFEMPQATGRFETNLARMDLMLTEIERLREHPAYTRIIGPLDAFTLNVGRARGAQAIYNTLMALGTAEELQSMRRSNETGGAVGNVSDADLKLLERGFAALDQSQMEEDFENSVKVLITRIKGARERLIKEYKDTYSYRLPKNWAAPSPKSKPVKGGRSVGGFTVLEVED